MHNWFIDRFLEKERKKIYFLIIIDLFIITFRKIIIFYLIKSNSIL